MKKIIATMVIALFIGVAGCSVSTSQDSTDPADGDIVAPGDNTVEFGPGLFGDEGEDLNDNEDLNDDDIVVEDTEEDDDADNDNDDGKDNDVDDDEVEKEDDTCDFEEHTIEVSDYAGDTETETDILISVKGGSGDFRWYDFDNALPNGMSTSDDDTERHITGTPSEVGSFSVNIRVKDNVCDRKVDKSFTIKIKRAIETHTLDNINHASSMTNNTPLSNTPTLHLTIEKFDIEKFETVTHDTTITMQEYSEGDEDSVNQLDVFRAPWASARIRIAVGDLEVTDESLEDNYRIKIVLPDSIDAMTGPPMLFPIDKETVHGRTFNISSGFDIVDDMEYVFKLYQKLEDGSEKLISTYKLHFNLQCKIAKLSGSYIRFRAWHEDRYDKGYCHGSTYNTRAGFALVNDAHPATKTGDKKGKFRGGIVRESFDLTTEADYDNVMAHQLKTIDWNPSDFEDSDVQCVEDITGFGVWFDEGGCAGQKPSYHVNAVELKVCNTESQRNSDSRENCYFATWDGEAGWSDVANNHEKVKNVDFQPIDEEGTIWSEKSLLKNFFEDLVE